MHLQSATEEQLLDAFRAACKEESTKQRDIDDALALLTPLRNEGPVYQAHYMHSLRVALVARGMGNLWGNLDGRALLLAGAMHDIGKLRVPVEVLGKSDNWTREDGRLVRKHVVDGYRMMQGRFDFSGGIMLWHHRFQANGYPARMPRPLHNFADATKHLIYKHGRILAMADVYDALHRENAKHGALTGAEIRSKMVDYNPDCQLFIYACYGAGILTA